jgi:N4-gp56 family major capsid protein
MADTAFGVDHPLAVKLWSKKLLHEALKATWVSKFIGTSKDSVLYKATDLEKEAGDKITYGLRMLLSGDGVQGDGTLEGNEEALSFFDDSIIINQLRHAVRSKGKMSEQRVPYSIREEARQGLTDWFADRFDTAFMNHLAGNSNITDTKLTGNQTVTAPDNDHWILATGVTGSDAEASLSASSIFNLTLIDRAVTKAKILSPLIRPIMIGGEKKFVMFIHPFQHYQLRNNTSTGQYMDIQKAAVTGGQISKNPIYTGAIAEYNGVVLHESTRVPWGTTTDTGVNPHTNIGLSNVGRAIFCGAQSGCIAFGKAGNSNLSANWKEELFDYGNQLGVAGGSVFGIKRSIFDSKSFGTITVSSYSPNPA